MPTPRDEMMEILKKAFPKLWTKTTEEFDGTVGGIWTTAEEGAARDGGFLFDYYVEDNNETTYIMGVHKEMHKVLEEHGWHAEFNDPGTVMLFY